MIKMSLRGKKILVTGHNGFVGRNLLKGLIYERAEVVTLTNENGERIDLRDWNSIKKIKDLDMIYHLGAVNYIPFSFENPRETYEINVLGTTNVLELARLNDVEKFIFTSSYVYGNPEYLPIDEKHPLNPNNPYSRSKMMGEIMCKHYCSDFGLKCVILRPFNIYGVGQSDNFLIPTIISQLKEGIIKLKDPHPRRDFIYISDVISAFIKVGNYDTNFDILNIGSGISISVKEIVSKIVEIYKKDVSIQYTEERRKNEIMDTYADIKRAKEKLDWYPKVDIDTGLTKVLHENI